MKSCTTITTVIPTYQRPHLLKKAIESVLNQTYPYFQLLICDNASGDETADVANEYCKRDVRVKYHCHTTNIGMMENYKFGIGSIQTEFFSILSDDDILLPWFYETALTSLINTPDAIFFAGSTIIMTQKGKVIRVPLSLWKRAGIFHPPEGLLEMIGKYPIPTGIIFRKEILNHVAIDEENPLVWDCDFLLNSAKKFPIVISQKPCAIFLQHAESYSFSQKAILWENSFSRLAYRLENSFDLPAPIAKEGKNRVLFELYNLYLQHKKIEKASLIAAQISSFISRNRKTALNLKIHKFHPMIINIINFLRGIKLRIMVEKKLQKQYKKYYTYMK